MEGKQCHQKTCSQPDGRTGPTTRRKIFISGVVEGFYGRPWTMEQRKELFRKQQKWGLNTYLYAPKDDYKHRMFWREMYSPGEAEQLVTLIAAAKAHSVDFIYAISPGLDITFSNQREVSTLKRKLDQVSRLGCKSFALLFDDIDADMCPADRKVFSSSAHAQVALTNEIYQHLGEPETFMICPTDYCASFCSPSVSESAYLKTVGDKLLPGIDVLWTGPKVVSNTIPVESIEEVFRVLKRPPVIWDNIHANDYDQKRLFLGPYKGRSTDLIPRLRGVLTNPNCEFEPNFVAIHTLATWCKSHANGLKKDVVMEGDNSATSSQGKLDEDDSEEEEEEEEETDELYSPRQALKLALADWLGEFGEPHQYATPEEPMDTDRGGAVERRSPEANQDPGSGADTVTPMQTDEQAGWEPYAPGPDDQPLYTAEALTLEDLTLMANLFYLPYEHGPKAVRMLKELHWVKANASVLSASSGEKETEKVAEWRSRAEKFVEMYEAVNKMFTRVCNSANRGLVYDLYPYILEIKSITSVAKQYVEWLGSCAESSAQFLSGDQEPFSFKGGLTGEFQRMLPNDGAHDLFRRPLSSRTYAVRPYFPKDEAAVTEIWREMYCRGGDTQAPPAHPDSVGDRLTDLPFSFTPDCGFVLEDEEGVCGYALGVAHAEAFLKKGKRSLAPSVQKKPAKAGSGNDSGGDEGRTAGGRGEEAEGGNLPETFFKRFPSLIEAQVSAKVTETSAARSMMGCLLTSLKDGGSHGAFCAVRRGDRRLLDLYSNLGSFEEVKVEEAQKNVLIMGKSL